MSYLVSKRVWKHSRQRGTTKLLLLAFAEFANDEGVCWPGIPLLADYINETERHTRTLIKGLISAGELAHRPGGGRGNRTVYGVVIGLNVREMKQINSVLDNSVYKNTDTPENSDISRTKTVISGARAEEANSAPESGKTPQNQNANHQGNHQEIQPPPTTTQPAQAGGGGEITETERLLLDFTPPFSASTAREFAHLPVEAVRAELKAAAAAGSGPGSLVARWRRVPPKAPVPKAASPPVLQATKPNLPERAVSGATLLAMAESARRNRA